MHASSNFVALFNGSKKDRKVAIKRLQQFADEELEDDVKVIFEETYEIVWLDDIIEAFTKIVEMAPKLDFAVSGYVDCSENSGEFMDFGIICKDGAMTVYSSDWEGYDDVEFNENGDADECYGRYDRFLEMQDLDVEYFHFHYYRYFQQIQ